LAWRQVSELKFHDNEVAVNYTIKSIPQNFLNNPEGIIIAKDLHGDELLKALAKLIQ